MTKEAVRALALAKLELHRARHLIDIGAGTGSVSIEAALQNPALRVTAIERQADALRLLAENRQRFGCDNIAIVAGVAPLAVADKADAIFMGGQRRPPDGADRLVAGAAASRRPAGDDFLFCRKTFIAPWRTCGRAASTRWTASSWRSPPWLPWAAATTSNPIIPFLSSPVRRKKTMAETFDPHCVWFVGAGPGDRELITLKGYRLLAAGAGSDLRRVADQHRATGLLSATGGVPRQRRAASGADPRPDGGGGEGGKNGGASADGRRLAIWLGARAGRRADPPRDPLAGGAGRQRFPRRGGGAGGWSTRYPKSRRV